MEAQQQLAGLEVWFRTCLFSSIILFFKQHTSKRLTPPPEIKANMAAWERLDSFLSTPTYFLSCKQMFIYLFFALLSDHVTKHMKGQTLFEPCLVVRRLRLFSLNDFCEK